MKTQENVSLLNRTFRLLTMGLLSTATLVACGGGGSSASTDPRVISENRELDLVVPLAATISPSLTLLYTLAPPAASSTGGTQTYASDLTVSNGLVFTAFNTVGTPQAGAIDIINPGLLGATPFIQSTKTFTDFDVNRAVSFNNSVWMVGALNNIGAWMRRVPVTLGSLGTTDLDVSIPSYAGTGLAGSGGNLYLTSGDTGGFSVVNASTGAITSSTTLNDARSVTALSNGDIVVLTGGSCGAGSTAGVLCNTSDPTKTPPTLTRYTSAGTQVWTRTLSGATIGESKSTVVAGGTYLVASLGDGGFSVICQADGVVMATQAAVTVSGLSPSLSVTNAVASAPGMILAANGQAGIYLYQIQSSSTGPTSSCAKIQLTSVGSVNFGDGSSANNIASESFSLSIGALGASIYAGRFYVANGAKGFRSVLLQVSVALGVTLINL